MAPSCYLFSMPFPIPQKYILFCYYLVDLVDFFESYFYFDFII